MEQGGSSEASISHEYVDDAVNSSVSEPMRLSESVPGTLPKSALRALDNTTVTSQADILMALLHVIMNESGYLSQRVDADAQVDRYVLPSSWKTPSGYLLTYSHPRSKSTTFKLTGLTLGPLLVVHGTYVQDDSLDTADVFSTRLKVAQYTTTRDAPCADKVKNLQTLSRLFKDSICYKLLHTAQPETGFTGLVSEVKIMVFMHLDVASLLHMSQTSRENKDLINDNFLWRHLYLRDFGKSVGSSNIESLDEDWKEKYKRKYIAKMTVRRQHQYSFTQPHAALPPLFYEPPDLFPGMIGGRYDLDPPFAPPFFGGRGPRVPRPRFDPIGPRPFPGFRPGRGGGLFDF